ncbi:MAG: hypothetical protein E7641_00630 [Ruminococcaceae bacterium]|nr:hypothetical protein [Oscillospiraceae bacterium]
MSRININIDGLIEKAEQTVASHKLGKGDYARWLWQNEKNDRVLGSNPYGVADAANTLYMIGDFPQDDEERAEFVRILREFQDPETGLFHEDTHHTYHTTAHCTAALELFDKFPTYPFTALKKLDDINELYEFLDGLDWLDTPWPTSHKGAGVFAAKVIVERPSVEWQKAYFDYLDSHCDKKYGMSREGMIEALPEDKRHIDHHLNGWFHYCFNYNHCKRQFPCIETFIDTLIDMYVNQKLPKKVFGRSVGFREIDWVFPLNRATWQVGYRREDAKEAMRDFATKYIEYLESVDINNDDRWNDLHSLFGCVCCLSELQLALPGEIISTKPLKNVLDRRPFI